jgi:uncharacterized membrane protein
MSLGWMLVPLLLLAVLIAVLVGTSAYFKGGAPAQAYGWWPWAPFGWFFLIPLFFVAFFSLRFFWWGWWGGRGWYHREDMAMEVLRERFARGELTKGQFEQMQKDLQG